MRKILLGAVALMILVFSANAQIVNNSGSTAADSIAFPFVMLDSAGNVVVMASNDSAFVHIYYPSGAIAFQDTVAFGNSLISTTTVATNVSTNTYKAAIADIDGSGKDGVFTYEILVTDASKARLVTPNTGFFQLYQAKDFNTWATFVNDSVQAIIDSLQLLDEKFTALRDTLDIVEDSVRAALDSLQLLDEKYTLIRDTLQNQDNQFIALRDTLDIALDSIRAALDSLQLLDEKFTALRDSISLVHAEIDLELDNIVEAFDNDGTMAPGLELTDIKLIATGNDTGFVARGSGSGMGAFIAGGTTGKGLNVYGGSSGGTAVWLEGLGGSSQGLVAQAAGNGTGIYAGGGATGGAALELQAGVGGANALFMESYGTFDVVKMLKGTGEYVQSQARRELVADVADTGQALDWDATAAGGTDTTNIKTMINNNWNLGAVQAKLGISGMEKDSTCLVRYFGLSGDDSDGKSWATAWSSMSKLNAFWKKLDTAVNYDGMNIVYVSADSFNFGGTAACSVFADNTWLIGAGERTQGKPASIWYKQVAQPADTSTPNNDSDLVRIYGNNVHILNMTLCAFDTVGDPDPGSGTGGNNAVTFDSTTNGGAIQGGEVAYCFFPPPNHKPLQANARGGSRVASNLWWHHNIFQQPSIHAMDGFLKNSTIEDNLIAGRAPDIGTGTGSAAIQLIGTGSTTNNHNTIRRNTITNFDVGIALISTDSNMITDNIINRVVTAPWSITSGFNNNMFVGNRVNVEYPVIDYGLIGNGGFEQWEGTLYTPFDWQGGNGTAGSGVRSEVHYDVPHTGGWAYLLAGSTSGSAVDGYVDGKLLHLPAGRYIWSGWMRPDAFNTPNAAYDTLGSTLFKDKVGGDSAVVSWADFPLTPTDTVYGNWSKIGHTFTINSEGNYYVKYWARGKTSSPSNTVFIDDIQLLSHMGDSSRFVLKSDTANQLTETIAGGGSGTGSNAWTIYVKDTTIPASPVLVQGATVTARFMNGTLDATGTTDGFGKIAPPWNVNLDSFVVTVSKQGVFGNADTIRVTANGQIDTVKVAFIPPPGAAATPEFVRAYIDLAETRIDSLTGQIIPYTQIELMLNLVGNPSAIAGGFMIIPREYKEKPNAAGRVIFDIPATTVMDPDGCYYILTFKTRVGQSTLTGDLGAFKVDVTPDPLNIIDAIQVWHQEND